MRVQPYLHGLCAAVVLLACKDTKVRRAPGDPRLAIEFRPASTEPLPGFMGPVSDPEGRSLFVGSEHVLGNAEIENVAVEPRGAGYGVMLFLTPPGASRLSAFTAAHNGRRLAVLIDGKGRYSCRAPACTRRHPCGLAAVRPLATPHGSTHAPCIRLQAAGH
jgi:preprotein translocase subunit SecD